MKDRNISKRKRFWAEIDVNAAEHNFNIIRQKISPSTKICCVVKANAYGHGAVYLSKLYERLGADYFAVSNIEEAMQLRNNGISTPILILGYTPVNCAAILAANNISQSVFSYNYARELNENAAEEGVKVKIHIKMDSGMGRIGFDCVHGDSSVFETVRDVCGMENLIHEGIFTHFASADEGEDGREYTEMQYRRFSDAVSYLEKRGVSFEVRHCANSAAIIDYPEYGLDMVRAGIALYGLSPSDKVGSCGELIPVMKLKSVISMIKDVEEGDFISYGCTFRADHKMKIATVPIGYADGFRRSNVEGGTQLLVEGKRVDIVGRVCMDQLMLDVTGIRGVKEGGSVTIIGSDGGETVSAEEIAKRNGTVSYEMVCTVGERVPRFYVDHHKIVYVKDNIVSYERDVGGAEQEGKT